MTRIDSWIMDEFKEFSVQTPLWEDLQQKIFDLVECMITEIIDLLRTKISTCAIGIDAKEPCEKILIKWVKRSLKPKLDDFFYGILPKIQEDLETRLHHRSPRENLLKPFDFIMHQLEVKERIFDQEEMDKFPRELDPVAKEFEELMLDLYFITRDERWMKLGVGRNVGLDRRCLKFYVGVLHKLFLKNIHGFLG